MQYKVPQNVDIEDKVIAGLTLRQFTFLMIAGGAVLMLYYLLPPAISFMFMPLGVLFGGFGIALAFIKINDRPLEIFIASAARTLLTPNQRVWQKEIIIEKEEAIHEIPKAVPTRKKSLEEIRTNLEKLAMIVDSGAHEYVEGRASNVLPGLKSDSAKDILQDTELGSERINKLIENAKNIVAKKKTEPTIGQISTNNPTKEQFQYENLGLTDEKSMETIIQKATAAQKEKEKQMQDAKIIKRPGN